jgi:tellurite resistance protein TerC
MDAGLPSALDDEANKGGGAKHLGSATVRAAMVQTVGYVCAACVFGLGLAWHRGRQAGFEFAAGYLVEQSLSVDNLFVFLMLFDYFKVPMEFQGRVLTWGIIGAVTMRGFMIVVGVAAVQRFRWIILVFAAILLLSSVKLLLDDDSPEDLSSNTVMRLSKWAVGAVDEYDGDRFFTTIGVESGDTARVGKRVATPLLLCLVCIELSDFVFAVDSIPAVIGVTTDLFIVYSSNIFAILGLRSLYVLVAKAVNDMPYLRPAVALVLLFISVKMILEFAHYDISTGVSLLVVLFLLTGGVVTSLVAKRRKDAKTHKKGAADSGDYVVVGGEAGVDDSNATV